MTCCNNDDSIIVVKGDDTDFNDQKFLTLNFRTDVWDLSELSASFTICGITKTYQDLSGGSIEIVYSAAETSRIPYGKQRGILKVFKNGKQVTLDNLIPFEFISLVHGNSIATKPFEYTIVVEQGGETVLNIDVEAGVSVEVGTTTTLPAGSDATVTNVGTPNHLVLDFGIPQGIQGETGEQGPQGETGPSGKDATIIIRRL